MKARLKSLALFGGNVNEIHELSPTGVARIDRKGEARPNATADGGTHERWRFADAAQGIVALPASLFTPTLISICGSAVRIP